MRLVSLIRVLSVDEVPELVEVLCPCGKHQEPDSHNGLCVVCDKEAN